MLAVTLYKCEESAKSCSQCLAVDERRRCGWCSSTEQCTGEVGCSSLWNTENATLCPPPFISAISPRRGPEQGGTILTIEGSDLGVEFTDIARVTVNGADCDLIETDYVPGNRLEFPVSQGSLYNDFLTI